MKYILNYHTQQEVEEKEGILSVSGETNYSEYDLSYETDTITKISGDTYGCILNEWGEKYLFNIDNVLNVTNYGDNVFQCYAIQPSSYSHDGDYDTVLFKFEQTGSEPVDIYYNRGTAHKKAIEGRVTIIGRNEVIERAYISRGAGDTYLGINKFDHEDGGRIYTADGWYIESHWISPVLVEKWKISSATPGAGYCKENRNVMYNGKWKSVTVYKNSTEKTYKKNYISLQELRNDFSAPRDVLYRDDDVMQVEDGYIFLKGSNGKRYEMGGIE